MKLIDSIEKLKSLHPPSDGSIRRELDQSLNETDPYSFSLSLKNYPIEDVEATPISIIENCNVSKFEVFTLNSYNDKGIRSNKKSLSQIGFLKE